MAQGKIVGLFLIGGRMPQSLARMHVLVFGTKLRQPLLTEAVRDSLHRYIAAILKNIDCPCEIVNSVEDHVHILFTLGRSIALCDVVEEVKKSSSKWLKTQGAEFAFFSWQGGYGAFAVSASIVPAVRRYIEDQREHHQKTDFQEEYRDFLTENNITFDERYVWD